MLLSLQSCHIGEEDEGECEEGEEPAFEVRQTEMVWGEPGAGDGGAERPRPPPAVREHNQRTQDTPPSTADTNPTSIYFPLSLSFFHCLTPLSLYHHVSLSLFLSLSLVLCFSLPFSLYLYFTLSLSRWFCFSLPFSLYLYFILSLCLFASLSFSTILSLSVYYSLSLSLSLSPSLPLTCLFFSVAMVTDCLVQSFAGL